MSTASSVRARPRRGRRSRAALALVLIVAGVLLGAAGPAGAHAVVVSSTPGDREQLTQAPAQVSVTFSEGVDLRLGGLSVLLGSDGQQVDDGNVTQPTPEQVVVGLRPDLPNGTYIVNYRVVSDDGHPVNGSLVFAVGAAVDEGSVSSVSVSDDPAMQLVADLARFVAYLGALLAGGVAFFTWFVHDRVDQNGTLRRITVVGAIVGALGLAIMVLAQAALATGQGIGAAFTPDTFVDTVTGSLGWSVLVVATALIVSAGAMFGRHELVGQVMAFYGLLGVGVGFALWGHSAESSNTWLTITADAVHGSAAGLWFGGLVALAVVLVGRIRIGRQRKASDAAGDAIEEVDDAGGVVDTVGVVIRFSTAATIAVALLALGGVVLAWVALGEPAELWSSDYGRVLLVKLGVAALVGVLAVVNHFRLMPAVLEADAEPGGAEPEALTDPGTEADPASDDPVIERRLTSAAAAWGRLGRIVQFEAVGLVVVLGITSVLVGMTPARSATGAATAQAGPFNGTKAVAGGSLNMVLTPALVGTNSIHLSYASAGRPADLAQEVTIELSLPDKGVGPITRVPTKAGVGHWQVLATDDLSIAGTWKVEVVSRLSEFEQERTTFEVPISP